MIGKKLIATTAADSIDSFGGCGHDGDRGSSGVYLHNGELTVPGGGLGCNVAASEPITYIPMGGSGRRRGGGGGGDGGDGGDGGGGSGGGGEVGILPIFRFGGDGGGDGGPSVSAELQASACKN